MTNAQTEMLVFKNAAGSYVIVARETWEQGLVPEEHTAEIERLLADAGDVSGNVIGIAIGIGLIAVGAGLVIYGQSIEVQEPGPTTAELIQQMVDAGNRVRQQAGRAP